jgi:hypothetical protein
MSRRPTNTMPHDTSDKNGSSPSTKKEWHNFLIPDRTLRPEGFHLCSENYNLAMAQHANILQLLSRIAKERDIKNNTSVVTEEKKDDEQQQQEGEQEHRYHPFLHVDRSLRPEGLHLVSENWNAHQICH